MAGQKLADIVDSYIRAYQKDDPERKGCALYDPLAVAVAVQVQVEEFTQLFSETNLTFLRNCL